MTLSGDPALVNLTLTAGIVYTPAGDYNGSDTLTIATGDGGNTGTGGVRTDSDEIAITVGAQNDAPELTGLGERRRIPRTALGGSRHGRKCLGQRRGPRETVAATLTLARQEGANPEECRRHGQLGITHSDESGENGRSTRGDLHRHLQPAGGRHTLIAFNGNASASDVDEVLRQITYTNRATLRRPRW